MIVLQKIDYMSQGCKFLSVWEAAFKRKFDKELYDWFFLKNNSIYCAFENDELIAGYCLLDLKAVFNKQIVKAALCNNVFVHPMHEGKNLFVKLGRFALSEAESRNVQIAYGMPNLNAIPGHKRVGWSFQPDIDFLEKPVLEILEETAGLNDSFKLLQLTKSSPNLENYLSQIEALSTQNSKKRFFSTVKTKSFFKWRFLNRPFVNYKVFIILSESKNIDGYIVLKIYEKEHKLHIIDIEVNKQDFVKPLLSCISLLEDVNIRNKFEKLDIWGSTAYREVLIKLGFESVERKNSLILIRPYIKEKIELLGEYNIVLGDNDVY